MLRHQTTDKRRKREQLKEKRKALLNAQLAKMRERKMKTKLNGTKDEAPGEAPAVKKLRWRSKRGETPSQEWDRGKVDFFGKWTSRRRDDSESEFTPRSVYFSDVKRQGYGKWAKRQQDKPKMAFKWSEGQGGGHKEPPQAKPKSSSLPQPQSSTPVPFQPTPSPGQPQNNVQPQNVPPAPQCPPPSPPQYPPNNPNTHHPHQHTLFASPFQSQFAPPPFHPQYRPPPQLQYAAPPYCPPQYPPQPQTQPQCPPQPQTQPPSQSLDDMLSFNKNSA